MRDAIKPNLLQTLENTPVIVHAGPFGNIAHGNSSIVADLIGIRGGDYLHHRSRLRRRHGRRAVLQHQVPRVGARARRRRARRHGAGAQGALRQVQHRRRQGAAPRTCSSENPDDVDAGAANLRKQIENVKAHGVTPVVAINGFPTDHASEHDAIRRGRRGDGRPGRGVHALQPTAARARPTSPDAVVEACEEPSGFHFLYPDRRLAQGEDRDRRDQRSTAPSASSTRRSPTRSSPTTSDNGFGNLPVCIAKTHLSISGDAVAEGRADRPHADRARGHGRRSAPASCTRSAARCARCRASAPRRRRRSSTSTRTARSSA